jgi:uncharacterized protein YutE (UPF0331/DUF86 family)
MKIKAFLLGVWQFRNALTQHYFDLDLADSYDRGREFAHRITLRRFEA